MGTRKALARRAPASVLALVRRRPASTRWLEQRLWNGFSASVLPELQRRSTTRSLAVVRRWRARNVLARFYLATGNADAVAALPSRAQRAGERTVGKVLGKVRALPEAGVQFSAAPAEPAHFDVVILSNFALKGGTTSSNIQEIDAQTRAGLTTGLVHHPMWDWMVTRPVNHRILELVDSDHVRFIASHERVTCDLLIIRAPKMGEHLIDEMPAIDAARTVVIVNQTPMYYYKDGAAHGVAYDLPTVAKNFTDAFGEATWFPIGPRVREALLGFHAGEVPARSLAPTDWLNIIDVAAWKREGRRTPDGTLRIGRHSRDDAVKWPENRPMLQAAYPSHAPFEVHVLGGADAPKEVLGSLPDRWVVHPFNALPVRDFLHSLDVYVYFTASTYTEAFGRAPLEALAVGLPVIVPESFRELFGDAALYCEPDGVAEVLQRLADDEEFYDAQVARAHEFVAATFDYGAHVTRLAEHGVVPPPAR